MFTKIRKFVNSDDTDFETLSNRTNIHDRVVIERLMDLLSNREGFLNEITAINHRTNERRKKHNLACLTARLKSEICLAPEKYDHKSPIEWLFLPKYLVPDCMSMGTYLAGKRKDWRGLANRIMHCRRKRSQIEIILSFITETMSTTGRTSIKVLDVCGGRGDLSMILAWMHPSWSITLVDKNICALQQAEYRALNLGMKNMKTHEIDLFTVTSSHVIMQNDYDLVVGLHACGSLTDMILEKFGPMTQRMLIATCCFGKMCQARKSSYSKIADADAGGNSEVSRLAKLVINSKRLEGITCRTKKILEVDEKYFGQKNQILYLDR